MAFPSADASTVALLLPDSSTLRDEFVSGLVQGSSWTFGGGPRVLTWSLNINEDHTSYPPGPPEPGPGGEWDDHPGMAAAVARALEAWGRVIDVSFQQLVAPPDQYYFESSADLAITLTGDDLDRVYGQRVAGAALFPDAQYVEENAYSDEEGIDRATYPTPEGDVFLDNFEPHFDYLEPGGAGFTVILHELAHALGLKHPHDDGASDRPTFVDLGIGDMDRMSHTVMSYDIVAPAPGERGFAATPMPLDILAIQHIYGANMSYRTGDNDYILSNGRYRTIWDAGGEDTLSAASQLTPSLLDLREGAFSGRLVGAKRMAIAYDVTIENAVGSERGDRIIGNAAANSLSGGMGDDSLHGRGGNDRLTGGSGADELRGGMGDDVLKWTRADRVADGGSGTDTLLMAHGRLDLTATGGAEIAGIERIDMSGGGSSRLTLAAQDLLDLSATTNRLKVLGDGGDSVRIVGSSIDEGMDGAFHRYRLGAGILLVDTDITVIT